jgi:integrase
MAVMKTQEKRRRARNLHKPTEVREGNTRLRIYAGRCRKNGCEYPLFTLCYYEDGKRNRRAFASLDEAKAEGGKVAARLERGERDVLKLTNSDAQTFVLAKRELKETGLPLLEAVRTLVAALKALPEGASLIEAAQEYKDRHAGRIKQKPVPEIVAEFLSAKEQDGASPVYLRTLRYHLAPFAERFKTAIGNVTARDLDAWQRDLGHTPRTRRNALGSLVTLFRFARGRGYLPKGIPTEPEGITPPRKSSKGAIAIITPDDLAKLLAAADTDERRIYVALAAFTGARASEIQRLEWRDIRLAEGYVELAAHKTKTQARRLVAICPALRAWLEPFAEKSGQIFANVRAAERLVQWAGGVVGQRDKNWFRHSWISYKLAETQNAAAVAMEAGNTPGVIFKAYRELVTKEQAALWFNILPNTPANVVTMKGRAA